MKIKTITCHDVYNVGASLQAYALQHYLESCGHDVSIIDYKPEYLSRHYSLTAVNNPKFDKVGIRQLYLFAKLPGRLRALKSKRKYNFDKFRREYLKLTDVRYRSNEQLKKECPVADLVIAGSDQIWNPVFPNGKDPAFFLEFVPDGIKKVSYAASFATDNIDDEIKKKIYPWLSKLDYISVRESSGVDIVGEMGLRGIAVGDPVFLVKKQEWERLLIEGQKEPYIFNYDFENNEIINKISLQIAKKKQCTIHSVFQCDIDTKVLTDMGPLEFVDAVYYADTVISNSFHATAFSLIFHKEFFVVNRAEKINTRMRDLLRLLGLEDRLISEESQIEDAKRINWDEVDKRLSKLICSSKEYLDLVTGRIGNE